MFKRLFMAALLMTFFSGSAFALGGGVSVGAFVPSSDKFDIGTSVSAYVDQGIAPMVALRLQGNYNKTRSKSNKFDGANRVDLTSTGGALLLKVTAPVPIVNLYAAAGWAVYQNKLDGGSISETKTGNGFIAQAGVGFSVLIVDLGVNATYFDNSDIKGAKTGGFSVGVGAGISF